MLVADKEVEDGRERMVHQCQIEMWRQSYGGKGKKWLYYFARQRGNTVG